MVFCYILVSPSLQAKTIAERSPVPQAFKPSQYQENGIFVDSPVFDDTFVGDLILVDSREGLDPGVFDEADEADASAADVD